MIQILIGKCMDGVILYINIHVKSTDLLIKKRENEGLKYKVGYVRYLSKQSCPPKSAMWHSPLLVRENGLRRHR